MMKIKHVLLTGSAMFGLLLLQNCGPGECDEHVPTHTEYNISSADKSKIPFTGTDTLVYISTDGDTAILYGQGKKVFMEKVAQNNAGDPRCPRIDYNYFENIEFTFTGDNPYLNRISLDISATTDAPALTILDLRINSVNLSSSFTASNYETHYKDSVTINQITYYGFKASPIGVSSFFYIYNYHYGILQIKMDNKLWFNKL